MPKPWGVAWAWLLATTPAVVGATPQSPSFDCQRVRPGSMAEWVCEIPALAALDRKLADTYAEARSRVKDDAARQLATEQRGWIRGRDECWKSDDVERCIADAYRRRTAELQARHGLLAGRGPLRLACGGPALTLTYFDTDPPTARIDGDGPPIVLWGQPAASGTRYQGRNEVLREHGGQTELQRSPGAPPVRCQVD